MLAYIISISLVAVGTILLVGYLVIEYRAGKRIIKVSKFILTSGIKYSIEYRHSISSKRVFYVRPHVSEQAFYKEVEYYSGRKDCEISIIASDGEERLTVYLDRVLSVLFYGKPKNNEEEVIAEEKSDK